MYTISFERTGESSFKVVGDYTIANTYLQEGSVITMYSRASNIDGLGGDEYVHDVLAEVLTEKYNSTGSVPQDDSLPPNVYSQDSFAAGNSNGLPSQRRFSQIYTVASASYDGTHTNVVIRGSLDNGFVGWCPSNKTLTETIYEQLTIDGGGSGEAVFGREVSFYLSGSLTGIAGIQGLGAAIESGEPFRIFIMNVLGDTIYSGTFDDFGYFDTGRDEYIRTGNTWDSVLFGEGECLAAPCIYSSPETITSQTWDEFDAGGGYASNPLIKPLVLGKRYSAKNESPPGGGDGEGELSEVVFIFGPIDLDIGKGVSFTIESVDVDNLEETPACDYGWQNIRVAQGEPLKALTFIDTNRSCSNGDIMFYGAIGNNVKTASPPEENINRTGLFFSLDIPNEEMLSQEIITFHEIVDVPDI